MTRASSSPRPRSVRITEVGPRDGLQNEKAIVSIEDKVAFIDALSRSGVAEIEVSSFVSPRWIPQLADAAEVFARISRSADVIYSALVPNERGLERALEAKVDKIAVFAAASETFSQKNINATIAESLARFAPVVRAARELDLAVRGYISCAVACPYEGPIEPAAVRDVALRLLEVGVQEIDLGDTIGVARADDIRRLYEGVADAVAPAETTLHLHDTHGRAIECAAAALELGVRSFDASCGGIGGCPYAPGAAGNIATEDLVGLLDREGLDSGVNIARLREAAAVIRSAIVNARGVDEV